METERKGLCILRCTDELREKQERPRCENGMLHILFRRFFPGILPGAATALNRRPAVQHFVPKLEPFVRFGCHGSCFVR